MYLSKLVPQIFENISKVVDFLEKDIISCFIANLFSFQENFEFFKSVAYF